MALTSERFKSNERLQSAAQNAPTMKRGERGDAVAIVQKAYVDLGFPMPGSTLQGSGMDGIFGWETYSVTRHFQITHKLGVDGIVGQQTLGRLDELFQSESPTGPNPPDPNRSGPSLPVPNLSPFLPPIPMAPATNVRWEADAALNGFDHTALPRWQMVPDAGTKIVRLMGGAKLTVTSFDPKTCSV